MVLRRIRISLTPAVGLSSLSVLVVLVLVFSKSIAQEPPRNNTALALLQQADAAAKPQPEFKGPQTCGICHAQAATPNPLLLRDFCLLAEVPTFLNEDKHAKAFEMLSSKLGKKMNERLQPFSAFIERRGRPRQFGIPVFARFMTLATKTVGTTSQWRGSKADLWPNYCSQTGR